MSTGEVTFNGETTTAVTAGSYTLVLNPDPSMKVSELRAGARDIEMLERRVLGRADGLNDDIDSAAKEFTEVIKWDIVDRGDVDLTVWMDVSASLRFCAGITEEWADCVSEYKRERRRIINRWNDEAPGHESKLGDHSGPTFIWNKTTGEKAEEDLENLKEELQNDEATAFNTLYTRSNELRGDLTDGPTPEAVQRLIDGGYSTWAYFNLGGDVESIPIDADPEEMANNVLAYAEDPDGYDGDITELTAILNNIALVAVDRKNNGGTLTREELNFLRDFYDSLEEAGGESTRPPGVLNIAHNIGLNADIEDDIRNNLLGGLGGGLLVLSDESLLGGYDNLPQSVRNTVEGPAVNNPAPTGWFVEASTLANMLGNTNAYVQGGEQFSVNLTQSTAYMLDGTTSDLPPQMTPWQLESLIDVSTRNEDANHAILTGEGQYEHPTHGLDTQMTLRGLYTHGWEDGGEAVSGLTDWIWQQADGEEHEQMRAAEAALGLILGLQGEGETNIFLDTGETVGENPNAAVTEINPELAESFTSIFATYIDNFGISTGSETDTITIASKENANFLPFFDQGDIVMSIDPNKREEFIQLLVANEDTEPRVMISVIDHEQRTMAGAMLDGDYPPEVYSNESGRLRSMVIDSMISEAVSRGENSEKEINRATQEAAAKWETAYKVGAEVASAGASALPVAGDVISAGIDITNALLEESTKEFIAERVEEEMKEYRERLDNGEDLLGDPDARNDEAQWNVELQMAHTLIREGHLTLEDLEPHGILVRNGEGDGEIRLPTSQSEWDLGHSGSGNALREVIYETLESASGNSNVEEIVDNYVEGYIRSFQPRNPNDFN